jgi:hypothetical protein
MESLVGDLLKELKEQRKHSDKMLLEQKMHFDAQLQAQKEQLLAQKVQHEAQMEAMMKLLGQNGTPKSDVTLMGEISQRIPMFVNDQDVENAFSVWYDRHKDAFVVDAKPLEAKCRVRLLLDKLEPDSFQKYKRHVLPDEPYTDQYDETVVVLRQLFDRSSSIFTQRYQLLRLDKDIGVDFLTYMGEINELCERTKLAEATADEWKSLLFVYGLKNQEYADVRKRLMMVLDRKHRTKEAIMLKDLYAECEAYLSTVNDSKIIGSDGLKSDDVAGGNVMAVSRFECYNCLGPHTKAKCRERLHTCQKCNKEGHNEKYCQKRRERHTNVVISRVSASDALSSDPVASLKMTVDVSGTPIEFVIDSGSEVTCISESDWFRLGCPPLKPCHTRAVDIMGRKVKFIGELECYFTLKEEVYRGMARVTKHNSVLGMDWMTRNESMRKSLSALIGSNDEKSANYQTRIVDECLGTKPNVMKKRTCRDRRGSSNFSIIRFVSVCPKVDCSLSVKDRGSLYPENDVYGSRSRGSATVSDEPWYNVCNRLAEPSSSRVHGVQSKTRLSHSYKPNDPHP